MAAIKQSVSDETDISLTDGTELHRKLTSAPVLVRSIAWNLIGQVAPMLVAVVSIPVLIQALGKDRFGVLTIAWMVVGYFSLFDLGLGRALTNLVAQALVSDDHERLPELIWTTNVLMLLLGVAGAVVLAAASPWVVHRALKIPLELQHEVVLSFYLLSASVPFAISTAGFRGVLEAKQRFGAINAVRVPMGIATFLAPLCVLPLSRSLVPIVVVLAAARAIFWLCFVVLVLRDMPGLQRGARFRWSLLPELFNVGGWMTVSNLVSPVMVYLDRFLIGALLSLTAVTYYSTPFEVSTRLLVLPIALVGVLFPAFSTALASDTRRAVVLFQRSVKYVSLTLAPILFLVIVFAREGLTLWLGADIAAHSTAVLQCITVGVLMNGLAMVPFAFIQGGGRPDITGKLHLAELPFYVATVIVLTLNFGIVGTAAAWTLRVTADCVCLFIFAGRIVSEPLWKNRWARQPLLLLLAGVPLSLVPGPALKALLVVPIAGAFAWGAWLSLTAAERTMLLGWVSRVREAAAATP